MNMAILVLPLVVIVQVEPIFVYGISCTSSCDSPAKNRQEEEQENGTHNNLVYKLVGIAAILVAGAIGVTMPLLLRNIKALRPETPIHFLVKAFAAGVILATGFIHILPDAFDSLTSPCLSKKPWSNFPFAGFIAMMAAILTLTMEALATGYQTRSELQKPQPLDHYRDHDDMENNNSAGHVHAPGSAILMLERSNSSTLLRTRIISQVLELGIVVHSVIIGISLGTTQSPKVIKPLIAALSFHQFFEGMGLGGCIAQAKFKTGAMTIMVLFFSLTTPSGIAIGIGISKSYNEYSATALIVEGSLNSASAGILIYMALVDLLASDFMNPKLLRNFKLQIGANFALLLGAFCMSSLATLAA